MDEFSTFPLFQQDLYRILPFYSRSPPPVHIVSPPNFAILNTRRDTKLVGERRFSFPLSRTPTTTATKNLYILLEQLETRNYEMHR